MEPVKIHRNINAPDQIFGLELFDGGVILLTFFLVFLFNRKGLFANLAILAAVYAALRVLKRGKPAGYPLILFRFILLGRFRRAPDLEEAEEISQQPRPESGPTRSKAARLSPGGNTCPKIHAGSESRCP